MIAAYRSHLTRLAERPQTLKEAKIDRQAAYVMLNFGWVRCDNRIWSLTSMGHNVLQ